MLRISGLKTHERKLQNELELDLEAGMLAVYLAEEWRCAKNCESERWTLFAGSEMER